MNQENAPRPGNRGADHTNRAGTKGQAHHSFPPPVPGFKPPQGPGRCPECGWHLEAMGGHSPYCLNRPDPWPEPTRSSGLDAFIEESLAAKRLAKLRHRVHGGNFDELWQRERDTLDAALDAGKSLEDYVAEQARRLRPRQQPTPAGSGVPAPGDPRVIKALRMDLAELARAPEGERNDLLNRTAGNLGRLPVDRNWLRDRLIEASHTNGLVTDDGENCCYATIDSGFAYADQRGPRTMPAPRPYTRAEFRPGTRSRP